MTAEIERSEAVTNGVLFTWQEQKGTITLLINGVECGSMAVPTAIRGSSNGMSIGLDNLSPVTDDYQAPFPFTGKINKVEINLKPFNSASDEHEDAKAQFNAEMSKQ